MRKPRRDFLMVTLDALGLLASMAVAATLACFGCLAAPFLVLALAAVRAADADLLDVLVLALDVDVFFAIG